MLVNNLACEGLSHFKHFTNVFTYEETARFLLRKNVYCNDIIDNYDLFEKTNLHPKDAFYNRLQKTRFCRGSCARSISVAEIWYENVRGLARPLHAHWRSLVSRRLWTIPRDDPGLLHSWCLPLFYIVGTRFGCSFENDRGSVISHYRLSHVQFLWTGVTRRIVPISKIMTLPNIQNLIYLDANNLHRGCHEFPPPHRIHALVGRE